METTVSKPRRFNVAPLKIAQATKGWTLKKISIVSNKPITTVWRVINGRNEGVEAVKAIAEVLGVPMSEIIVQPEGATK